MEKLKQFLDLMQASSGGLAAMVVAYKTLGINKEMALHCMTELGRRRKLGEDFNFEEFIEEESKKVQKFQPMDLSKIAQSFSTNINAFKRSFK